MALQLTAEEFDSVREAFLHIDRNGDGMITKEELTEYFIKGKEDMVEFTMKLMDMDRSGTIQFHEFLEMTAFLEYKKGIAEWKIKRFFRALDEDGNGVLSADEIRNFYNVIIHINTNVPSKDEIDKLIASLDSSGDGIIDKEEFIKGYFKTSHLERPIS